MHVLTSKEAADKDHHFGFNVSSPQIGSIGVGRVI